MWRKSELINIDESSPCTINTYYIILRYCIVIVLFTSNSKKAAVFFSHRTSFPRARGVDPWFFQCQNWLLPGLREFMGSSEDLGHITGMGRKRWKPWGFCHKIGYAPPKKLMVYHSYSFFYESKMAIGPFWWVSFHFQTPSEPQRPSRSPWCAPANTRRLVVWGTDAAVKAMGRDSDHTLHPWERITWLQWRRKIERWSCFIIFMNI